MAQSGSDSDRSNTPTGPQPTGAGNSTAGGSGSSSGGAGGGGGVSWSGVEAKAAGCPGFTRFTSPDLHVRAFSSTAILFKASTTTLATGGNWPASAQLTQAAVQTVNNGHSE